MARDKGYGRHHIDEETNLQVQCESKVGRELPIRSGQICAPSSNYQELMNIENEPEHCRNVSSNTGNLKVDLEAKAVEKTAEKVVYETVSSLSSEQISQHPFVVMMMQRLQALEDKQSGAACEEQSEHTIEAPTAPYQTLGILAKRNLQELQVRLNTQQNP